MVSDMRVNLLGFDFSYLGWIRPNETLITPSYIIKELKQRDVIGLNENICFGRNSCPHS